MNKRILVLLSVVALMVVMLATSVAPAFAAWNALGCKNEDDRIDFALDPSPPPIFVEKDRNQNGFICQGERTRGGGTVIIIYDDHPR